MELSPIVLFVYNRPRHIIETIKALSNNALAIKSELFIYSDAAKNNEDLEKVNKVRRYIHKIKGFKNVHIVERSKNWSLANNIIDGVTNIINQYGKVIVLEDDIVTSPYFLSFMNRSLNFYKDQKKVWHISGWTPPFNYNGLSETFFWRVMNCYGWATWADRWRYFEKNPKKIVQEFSRKDIRRFNLEGGKKFWKQLKANKKGKISTWAIFWYATIFKNQGLCLNPSHSFVRNIGFDSSGTHCLNKEDKDNLSLCQNPDIIFEQKIEEYPLAVKRIKEF